MTKNRVDEDISGVEPSFLKIYSWETPATKYPLMKSGKARLSRKHYKRGFYNMEGVRGYDYFTVKNPIPVTSLIVGKETWMIDDPLHWYGMQDLAKAASGKVLVASGHMRKQIGYRQATAC